MRIEWLGLSCFKISAGGADVVLDPYKGVRGYGEVHTCAGLALKSHDHGDHAYLEGVQLLKQDVTGIKIERYASFHDEVGGKKRGANTVHILCADGVRVAHLGDLGHIPDKTLLAALKDVDALLIPVGGFYTIDAQTAKRVIQLTTPKAVVPMHYREGDCGHEVIGTLEDFLELWTPDNITRLAGNSFTVGDYTGIIVPRFTE